MIDNTDRKLLYALDKNCRQSATQLSKQLRIHRNVVLYRIKRLEESQVIKGYFTDINTKKIGYQTFRLLFNLSNYSKQDEDELTKYLINISQLIWFFKTEGKYDYDIVYVSKSTQEFYTFIEQLKIKFNKIIADEKISTLIHISYYGRDYLIKKKREKLPLNTSNEDTSEIDDYDMHILNLLSNDGKMSIIDLANETKLSINTVRERIKKLEKSNIILGYRPFIDTEKSGYKYYKLFINLKNYNSADLMNITSFFEFKNSTIFTTKYLNGDDLEIEMHLENDSELSKLKEDLISQHGKIIKELYVLKFVKEYIFRYLPKGETI